MYKSGQPYYLGVRAGVEVHLGHPGEPLLGVARRVQREGQPGRVLEHLDGGVAPPRQVVPGHQAVGHGARGRQIHLVSLELQEI